MKSFSQPFANEVREASLAALKARKLDQHQLECIRRVLQAFAPDEPLGPPEGDLPAWPKRDRDLRSRYPGYQPGHWYQEDMKYGRSLVLRDDGPLSAWISVLINHAKAKWSLTLAGKMHSLQFVEFVPYYLTENPFRWRGVGMLDEAAEFLRTLYDISAVLTPRNHPSLSELWPFGSAARSSR